MKRLNNTIAVYVNVSTVKRCVALLFTLSILLLAVSSSLPATVKAQSEIKWVYDYPTGMKEAAEKNQPVMIYIHEQWCPKCRDMDQNTWNNSEVVTLSSSFVNINVIGTEQGRLYNYINPPLIVFTDPQGTVILTKNEELSASQVTALQRQVLGQASSASSSPTPHVSNTPAASNVATVSPNTAAKAIGVPGFEAIFAVISALAVAVVLRIGQQYR